MSMAVDPNRDVPDKLVDNFTLINLVKDFLTIGQEVGDILLKENELSDNQVEAMVAHYSEGMRVAEFKKLINRIKISRRSINKLSKIIEDEILHDMEVP